MTEDKIFHLKKYTWFQGYNFSLFGRDVLLWNCFQRGPPFHTFHQIFYKNFNSLVLSYNLPHFVTIFKKIDEKTKNLPRYKEGFISM